MKRDPRARTHDPSSVPHESAKRPGRRRGGYSELRRRCKAAELQVALEQDVARGLLDQIDFLRARVDVEEEAARVLAGQVEALMLDRVRLWTAAVGQCRILSDVDAGERVALTMVEAIPVTDEAVSRTFLGMNLYGWLSVPDELVSIFGLQDAVRRWRWQLSQTVREEPPAPKRESLKRYMH